MAMPIRISQKSCTLYIGRQVSNVHNVTCLKVSLCLMVDGVLLGSFQETCQKLGLLEDDEEVKQ